MRSCSSRVVVIGAGGHGSEINGYMEDLIRSGWTGEFLGFVDDTLPEGPHCGMTVIGSVDEFAERYATLYHGVRYLTAVGDNSHRLELVSRIEALIGLEIRPWVLIHPSAVVGHSKLGEGTLVAAGAVVTSRTSIGRHCIVNVKASVSHDCVIGDFVSLNPGSTICGHCHVGDGVMIGAGATVIDRIRVGEGAIVGAGAVVVCDIPPNVTAVGVPAKVIETRSVANYWPAGRRTERDSSAPTPPRR